MIKVLLEIGKRQPITAFLRAHAPTRDEHGNVAVAFAVGSQQHQFWPVLDLHLRADDEFHALFFRRLMRAHNAGERTLIGDRERAVAHRLRARHQFRGVRCTAQEGEVAQAMQLGVGGEVDHLKS